MYQTTGQEKTMAQDPTGAWVEHWRITYKNDDGTIHGHVTIPDGPDWETQAIDALKANYAKHEQVAQA